MTRADLRTVYRPRPLATFPRWMRALYRWV